jgi:hypothetical protein
MDVAKVVLEYIQVLSWPAVVLILLVIFRSPIKDTLYRLKHVDLPGSVSLDLQENIHEAKALSQKVEKERLKESETKQPSIPLTEANARIIKLGLRPSPSGLDMDYYRKLATQDPTLALAGLRIEIDILASNLAKGFNVPIGPRDSGSALLRKLADAGAITMSQFELTQRVLQLCNFAIHGQLISKDQAESILKLSDVLAKQYVSWLSWGFKDK